MKKAILEHFNDLYDDISVSLFENHLDDSAHTVHLHFHDRLEIIHVLEGKGTLSLNLREIDIHAGNILLIAPNEIHSVRGSNGDILHCQTIVFDTSAFGFPAGYRLKTLLTPDDPGYTDLMHLHEVTFHINGPGMKQTEQAMYGLLLAMCGVIKCCHLYDAGPLPLSTQIDSLKDTLTYISQHFTEKISIASLAERAGYSTYYFSHFFSQSAGDSCIHYLNLLRLQEAKKKLRHSGHSIEQIAGECGFTSSSYFIRFFKKEEKITPLQYRKNYGSGQSAYS